MIGLTNLAWLIELGVFAIIGSVFSGESCYPEVHTPVSLVHWRTLIPSAPGQWGTSALGIVTEKGRAALQFRAPLRHFHRCRCAGSRQEDPWLYRLQAAIQTRDITDAVYQYAGDATSHYG